MHNTHNNLGLVCRNGASHRNTHYNYTQMNPKKQIRLKAVVDWGGGRLYMPLHSTSF